MIDGRLSINVVQPITLVATPNYNRRKCRYTFAVIDAIFPSIPLG